jgi:hypothetical protein
MQKDIQALQGELKKAEKWIIWLTAAMAFFALCGVVVGILQWAAIHGQLNVMEASERPYVGVLEVRTQPEAAGTQLILPTLKNFGKNPAFKFSARWVVYVDGKELEGKNANGPRTPFTLYPTANQVSGFIWLRRSGAVLRPVVTYSRSALARATDGPTMAKNT